MTSPPPLRVVLADDHPFYRQGLAGALRTSGIEVAAEAANGEAALRAVDETGPDVVVMDINMPRMSGLEATRALSERRSTARVLMLSVSATDEDVTDALLAGAVGYIVKERPIQEVIDAIRGAVSGESHISPEIAMPVLRRVRDAAAVSADATRARLSQEEHRVLNLLAARAQDHEIADALEISLKSLRGLASHILRKLQLGDGLQAALGASRDAPG